MNTYLMSLSIGPVQGFIAAARRLRDLWFGSYLLSELAKQAGRSLDARNAALIFPAPADAQVDLVVDSAMKAPNKLLAVVHTDDPRALFDGVKTEIIGFWKGELAEKTLGDEKRDVNIDLFNRQIDDFLEIYGVWVPLNGDEDYKRARKRAGHLMASRKSLRNFAQLPPVMLTGQGGGLPKSSLDGLRESVLKRDGGSGPKRGIKRYEELDALGWIKRYGRKLGDKDDLPVFESLSDLAADPFLRGSAGRKKACDAMADLVGILKKHGVKPPRVAFREHRRPLGAHDPVAPQALFWSRMTGELEDRLLESNGDKAAAEKGKREILRQVSRVHGAAGMKSGPLPYTAILMADGDEMGKTIIDILSHDKDSTDMDAHRNFSCALDRFADACEEIVDRHHGSLIYSGGDDVLAFVPLDTVLECADDLRGRFFKSMDSALPAGAARPTLSVGIGIVHHLSPMNRSLDVARQAERTAKNEGGRNALALIVEKRSGAPVKIFGKWSEGIKARLDAWTDCHRRDLIPDRLGYELRRLCREFDSSLLEWTPEGEPANPLAFEFLQTLNRKRSDRGRRELKDADREMVQKTAAHLKDLEKLAGELIAARLMARAKEQAEPPKADDRKGKTAKKEAR